jgi:hypothetical protein
MHLEEEHSLNVPVGLGLLRMYPLDASAAPNSDEQVR